MMGKNERYNDTNDTNDANAFFVMLTKTNTKTKDKDNDKDKDKDNDKDNDNDISSQAAEGNSDVSEFGSAAWLKFFIAFRSEIVIGKK